MPLFGTLDLDTALADAPTMTDLSPKTWQLPGAEVLQVSYEVDEAGALGLTPSALHPSIPPYATFSSLNHPESPCGPYRLIMVRLIVRAGIRPRGLLLRAFTDNPAVATELAQGWGYRISEAEIKHQRRHDRTQTEVSLDGIPVLSFGMVEPEPVSGGDLELFDNLHLAQVKGEGPLIVQVDPTYEYSSAERGSPVLDLADTARMGIAGLTPAYPIVAVGCQADMTLEPPRFVIDPSRPAVQGTRRL